MKIAIVIGSTRLGRNGKAVGQWVADQAANREQASYEVVDLVGFDLPIFNSPVLPSTVGKHYEDERVAAWSRKIDEFDGYIFVTPEYNHTIPGVFKNAFDWLGSEWKQKTVAFLSYGADNGVRATENWRIAVASFSMYDIRATVALNLFTEFGEDGFKPLGRRAKELAGLFDELEPATKALKTLRDDKTK